jgi:N utilization substance protein A
MPTFFFEAKMNQELLATLEYIEKEKGIDKETLLETLKLALLSALHKTYSEKEEFEVEVDPQTADIRVLRNGKPMDDAEFGRIAAQTAKQVIVQPAALSPWRFNEAWMLAHDPALARWR